MKELTIEEKAKAYDEALERIRKELQKCGYTGCDTARFINRYFPELKESEDERVRKELIAFLKENYETGRADETWDLNGIERWIAWLEKQGKQESINPDALIQQRVDALADIVAEQNPTDELEPKFHKGEWITNGDYTWKIVEVKPLDYILQSQDGNIVDDTISHVDEHFHSFTTEDAKDGDVLYSLDSKQPFIFKHRKPNEQAKVYCGINIYGKFFVGNTKDCIITTDKYTPATKEQRDTLFAKMKKAGYAFDFETKELKKIDTYCQENCKGFQETGRCFCDGECKAKKEYIEQNLQENNFPQIEQKPAWSKEDDYDVQCLIAKVTYDIQKGNIGRNQELIDWLKSLKYRMNND